MISSKLRERIVVALLLFCILLGIVSRSVEVINKNYIWGFDHGRDYFLTKEIAVDHNLRLIGTPLGAGSAGFQGVFHGPGYYYFLAIPFLIYDGDPYGGVVLMFVFGIASLAMGFILGKKLFGISGGLVLATLIAISPPLISQSRSIWNSHPSTLFILLSLYFTHAMFLEKKNSHIFLASFFAAFVYNFEFAVAVPMCVSLLIYSIYYFRANFKRYLYLAAGFLVGLIPMIIFEIRHGFSAITGMISYVFSSNKATHDLTFIENAIDHLNSFLYGFINTFPSQNIFTAQSLSIVLGVILLFVLRGEKGRIKSLIHFMLLSIIVTFLIFLMLRNAVYFYYLLHLTVFYIVIMTYVVMMLYKMRSLLSAFLLFIFCFFLLVSIPKYLAMINYDLYDYGGDAKIRGKTDAIDFIYKDANGEEFGLLVFTPPVYTYPYDYLVEWYGKNRYNYIPHKEKKGNFYLLMEVDPSKPWSRNGWLETVIKTGDIVYEKKLDSGLIVQKRFQK